MEGVRTWQTCQERDVRLNASILEQTLNRTLFWTFLAFQKSNERALLQVRYLGTRDGRLNASILEQTLNRTLF